MTYQVKLTGHAVGQIKEIVGYISEVLLEPEVARGWSDRLKKEIASLDTMPRRYPLVSEEPWHTEGVRRMPVGNFLVYYWVNEETKTVWITAVLYGRQDQISALRQMPKA
jgi:toxin ParE1/3/4